MDSPAVQSYLGILQGVINRMAANSASCKTWCITLVSAIIVIVAGKGAPRYLWISILPIVLFVFLDSYYLGLEIRFRDHFNGFIKKMHDGTATVNDLFIVTPGKGLRFFIVSTVQALFSLSVWPFYGLLLVMMLIVSSLLPWSGGSKF